MCVGAVRRSLFVLAFMHMCVFVYRYEPDDSDDCVEPTHERRRIYNEEALQLSLSSGRYPEYLGIEGPQDRNNLQTCNPLDFLFLLWPESLCGLIVDETNRYGRNKPNWLDIDRDALLAFLGLNRKCTALNKHQHKYMSLALLSKELYLKT